MSVESRVIDLVIGLLLVYAFATSLWEAARQPFWYDEVFTVLLAQRPTWQDTFAALRGAADTSGPLYYVIVRAADGLVSDVELAYRLPSSIAAVVALGAVYLFARRDLGPVAGSVAVLVMLLSRLNHGFSLEARPYAAMVMFVCVAALAWQRAARPAWVVVLGLCGASAVATHYYSVFAGVPFAVAEAVRTVRRREVRIGVWIALSAGLAALAAIWPLLDGLREYYGTHYWSKPTLGKAMSSYDWAFFAGVPGAGFGIALVLGLAMLLLFFRLCARKEPMEWHTPEPETLALVMSLLTLPVIAVACSRLMGGGFSDRYALGVVAGIGLAVAYAVRALDERKQVLTALAMSAVFGAHELVFWASSGHLNGRRTVSPLPLHQQLAEDARHHGLPIVVDNGMHYLPLAFYGVPGEGPELITLTDPEAARYYTGTDSIDLDLIALKPHATQLQIRDFREFHQERAPYLLLSTAGGDAWGAQRLLDEGYTLVLVNRSALHQLYRVVPPPAKGES